MHRGIYKILDFGTKLKFKAKTEDMVLNGLTHSVSNLNE